MGREEGRRDRGLRGTVGTERVTQETKVNGEDPPRYSACLSKVLPHNCHRHHHTAH